MPINRETLPGLIPENPLARWTMDALMKIYVPHVYIHGKANIEEIRRLRAKGTPVSFYHNHLSNVDAPAVDHGFRKNGYDDIADEIIFIKGKKLQDEAVTRFLTQMVPSFLIWPPTIETNTEEEKAQRHKLNFAALKSSKEALKQGNIIDVFPEGGRSRTQSLRAPVNEVSGYFSLLPNEVIVPIGIVGSEKIVRVGQKIPRRGEVHIIVGKPFAFVDVEKLYSHLPKKDRRAAVMNHVMRELAWTLPQEYRGIYEEEVREHYKLYPMGRQA